MNAPLSGFDRLRILRGIILYLAECPSSLFSLFSLVGHIFFLEEKDINYNGHNLIKVCGLCCVGTYAF